MDNTEFNLDLDVISFEKGMTQGESIVYVRSWEDNISFVVRGSVPQLTNAMVDIKQLHQPILMAAAFLIKKENVDIEKYKEMIV